MVFEGVKGIKDFSFLSPHFGPYLMTNPGQPTEVIAMANSFEAQPPAMHYVSNRVSASVVVIYCKSFGWML